MKLISRATLQIQKPIKEVYEAIVNPKHMKKYFISESSGLLESGKEVIWKFPEFEDKFTIKNVLLEADHIISFVWDPETVVNIVLKSLPDKSTLVKVTEGGKEFNEQNLKWLINNTAGWSNFLACMKAYLEYGIQLRKGAYEFMRNVKQN